MPGTELTDDELAPFLDDPPRAGIVTDFDGTLAPIVDEPTASRPLPEAVEILHRLGHRFGRVAVVSGRPAAFLAEQLRLAECPEGGDCSGEGLVVAGLYGLETAEGEEVVPHPDAEPWRQAVEQVASLADEEAPTGLVVERKGLSVTLHYRTAPKLEGWVSRWADEQARRTGLALHPGRMSQELRPPVDADKGTAVAELVRDLDTACFIGDDLGDLPAFEALDRLAEEKGMVTLKVAVLSDESPEELVERSDLEVEGPEGVLSLLRRLLSG